jgi:hypothetical protein
MIWIPDRIAMRQLFRFSFKFRVDSLFLIFVIGFVAKIQSVRSFGLLSIVSKCRSILKGPLENQIDDGTSEMVDRRESLRDPPRRKLAVTPLERRCCGGQRARFREKERPEWRLKTPAVGRCCSQEMADVDPRKISSSYSHSNV